MKISITVMIAITILSIALPYLWFLTIGKKNNTKQGHKIKALLSQENIDPEIKELWANNFIGINNLKNTLIFIKYKDETPTVLKFDLNKIKDCKIKRTTKEIKKSAKVETELQVLDLELTDKNGKTSTLNFFHVDDLQPQDFEMDRAEKWQNLIEQRN